MTLPRVLRPRDVAPDELDDPFWQACREHRFLVHRCGTCGRSYWPASCCIDHGSVTMEWQEASGRGVVHTFTIAHHAYEPSMADRVPYAIAVVQLAEGPFFHTDIVGCDPADVHVGMDVEATYDQIDDHNVIPRFTPAGFAPVHDRTKEAP